MKWLKDILLFLFYMTSVVLSAQNADKVELYVNEVEYGKTWTLSVHLENQNSGNYTAFQMDLVLPQGFVVNDGSAVLGNRIVGHSLTVTKLADGKTRIIGYSTTNRRIEGNTGELFNLKIGGIGSEMPQDGYSVGISNIIFSNRDGSENNQFTEQSIRVFTISYWSDGKEFKRQAVQENTSIIPLNIQKEGYTFQGWSDLPKVMPSKNLKVSAKFTINTYKIKYMVDGVEYKSVDVNYGESITPEVAPTKEGHTFSGWSGIPQTMPANDITVTGTFSINTYTITYMVDGAAYKSVNVVYGESITPEAAPTKEGHTFSGWNGIPQTMPAKDITVTGTFSINTYTITYMVDGAAYKSVDVVFGKSITPEVAPTKEGHTFSGWSEIPQTMPANDITVTGTFSINTYTITYMVDGVAYKSVDVVYGGSIVPEVAPTKEGHTFSGWSEIPQTMPANDVTVNGSFSVNTYTITYILNGKEYAKQEVKYGDRIVPLEVKDTQEERFLGWESIPQTMPAHDLIIQGKTELTGIEDLSVDAIVDVFTMSGVKILSNVMWKDVKSSLRGGLYIVNGKTVCIRNK